MRKQKKIYYSAGLISIIMLPVLCIIYLKNIDAFTQYGSMNLYVWDGKVSKEDTKFLNSKKFTIVNLTGDSVSDSVKLKIAQKSVRQITSTKDSIKGIKFHFENKAEYRSYIRVLEILQIENAQVYLPYKDDIWFTNPKPIKTSKYSRQFFRCGTGALAQQTQQNEPQITWQKTKIIWQEIIEICKKYYPPIIAYILLVFFTLRRIINEKKGIR